MAPTSTLCRRRPTTQDRRGADLLSSSGVIWPRRPVRAVGPIVTSPFPIPAQQNEDTGLCITCAGTGTCHVAARCAPVAA
jgi:hypothetical protein